MAKIEEVYEKPVEEQSDDFLSLLLKPGSSLNPTFLLILDGAFATLLLVFFALLVITHWSIHIVFLIIIEGCLWVSVKWCVQSLVSLRSGRRQPLICL